MDFKEVVKDVFRKLGISHIKNFSILEVKVNKFRFLDIVLVQKVNDLKFL